MTTASSSSESAAALADWLEERHRSIRDCELRARASLYDDGDEAAFRALMAERAKQIAALDVDSAPLVAALPDSLRGAVADTLADFSAGARTAFRIGSVFYMSALLYPDEHKQGEPDNLQRLIAGLVSQQD
jgi:hypothetical protein